MKLVFIYLLTLISSFVLAEEYNEDAAYEVVVEQKGPMGFEIGTENGWLVVSHIIPGSFAAQTGMIELRDRLVAINDYPLEDVSLSDFQTILSRSSFPRRLLFVPLNDWDRDDETLRQAIIDKDSTVAKITSFKPTQVYLNIIEPEIMSQSYGMILTPIGEIKLDTETEFNIISFDNDGCEDYPDEYQNLTNKIVIVWRGTCLLPEKANKAQNRGAAAIIVVNNVLGAVPDTSKVDTAKYSIKIPFLYVDWIYGNNLIKVAMNIKKNKVKFSSNPLPIDSNIQLIPVSNIKHNNNEFFKQGAINITFFNEEFNYKVEGKLTMYGPPPLRQVFQMNYVGTGCSGFNSESRGSVIMFDRGECAFEDKTRLCEKIKGVAAIFVNDKDKITQAPATNYEGITIGSVMIGKSDGDILKAELKKRVVFVKFY